MNNNKITGILGVVFGLAILIVFYIIISAQHTNIIDYRSKIFAVKYFLPIAFVNGSLYFIIFGILNYLGFLKPFYSDNNDKYDKAKNYFFGIIISIPMWASGTIFILNRVDKTLPITLWFIILFAICVLFLSSMKTIKKNRHKGKCKLQR